MDNIKVCCRCHKPFPLSCYMRKNYKQSGIIREWKVCNECIINKLKKKVENLNKDYNIAYNYITPYNE